MNRRMVFDLFILLVLAGCNADFQQHQEKHRLYLHEPNLVRNKGLRLGMSYETVHDRLGAPAHSLEQRINRKQWASWTYAVRAEDWKPPGSDGDEAWPTDSSLDPQVVSRARLYLTFRNGRLVAIDDPVYNLYQVSSDLDQLDEDTVNRLRKQLYESDKRRR